LRAGFPLPILVCQHMPAQFTRGFADRLGEACALPVQEVTRPTAVEPGQVYLGRGDADLVLLRRGSSLMASAVPAAAAMPWHPSAARLVETAMAVLPASSLIGVMLTGMGNDGAEQMAALRRAGGRTIAESADSAVIFGMPQELIRRDGAEAVLPAHAIAARLDEWAHAVACRRGLGLRGRS
jgi:two-component system chemotaxis response regulator CheB